MKTIVATLVLLAAALPASAQRKDCLELKAEIEAKLARSGGVDAMQLTIVDTNAPKNGRVVGTCDGGVKSVVYGPRTGPAPAPGTQKALAAGSNYTGIVKSFNDSKGYGFITPDNGAAEVMAHHSAIQQVSGFKTLKEGQKVTFDVVVGPKGAQASNVRPN
jgi:CspA family cold shock protein